MRVLMLSWEYPPHNVGGLGKHVGDLVPALDAQGVEVHLLTPRWVGGMGEEVIAETATVYRVEPPAVDMSDFFAGAWRSNVNLELKGRELIDESAKYDLIHVHDWLVAFAGVALKHAYKIPLVATIHATEYGRSRGWLGSEVQRAIHNVEWWLSFEAWRVIACSGFMRDEIATALNSPLDKIDIIPNGVETTHFDALAGEDLTTFRARFADPDEKIVYYVGRVVAEKGIQVLVEAAPRILRRMPRVKFVIAGTGSFIDQLRRRAGELGVAHLFFFTGFISDEDRNRLFRVADVAVFPSLYEPFGIVALEAMAARTPLVVAGVGGFAEVVTNHETGIVVHPGNPDSLAWGVLHTLLNPVWARARVENAYRLVVDRYNWKEIARLTQQVYRKVALERQAAVW